MGIKKATVKRREEVISKGLMLVHTAIGWQIECCWDAARDVTGRHYKTLYGARTAATKLCKNR